MTDLMGEIIELWKFPVPSTSISGGGVRLFYPGGDAQLLFDYYDKNRDAVYNSGVLFEGVQAHRHTCEKFLENESEKNVKLMMHAYDMLVEFVDSEWVEYFRVLDKNAADFWDIKHVGIFLESSGFFEFIAEGFRILETKEGRLDEL